jgi:hypothetical protein
MSSNLARAGIYPHVHTHGFVRRVEEIENENFVLRKRIRNEKLLRESANQELR